MTDDIAPLRVSEDQSNLEAIRKTFEDELYANDLSELTIPVVSLFLYSMPAFAAAFKLHSLGGTTSKLTFSVLSVLLIAVGLVLYISKGGVPGQADEPADDAYTENQSEQEWPWTFPPRRDLSNRDEFDELESDELDILLSEYEQISEEVRYRDGLLNRTTYFGIAILGILAAALDTVALSNKPLLVFIISITMFIFAMALVKYKDARDLHWKRKRDLERLIPEFRGKLTAFHVNRTAQRRFLDRFSLTSFMINTFLTLFAISLLGYLTLIILLPWILGGG
jgi:hypothetical protein